MGGEAAWLRALIRRGLRLCATSVECPLDDLEWSMEDCPREMGKIG